MTSEEEGKLNSACQQPASLFVMPVNNHLSDLLKGLRPRVANTLVHEYSGGIGKTVAPG